MDTTAPSATARLDTRGGAHTHEGMVPILIRIGRSHHPCDPAPLLIPLAEVGELALGRGKADGVDTSEPMVTRVELADPSLSSRHARLMRLMGPAGVEYVLEDLGSTNGCRVGGLPIEGPRVLAHGDVIETGQTFWCFWRRALADAEEVLALAYAGGPLGFGSSVSPSMLQTLAALRRVAKTELSLIICGESGTGKEGLAQELHRRSGRSGPLIALNCAAIPEGLIESELFGHRRGAFTGAVADKRGLIEEAQGGTLLLDEVGDMPLPAQAKLLRVLQERSYMRLGETRDQRVDVRFIAATHRDLRGMVAREEFRGDLFARLDSMSLRIPPLRCRREDMGLLLATFLGREFGGDAGIDHKAYRALVGYDWPFNVRELEKAIAVGAAFAGGALLERRHLPETLRGSPDEPPVASKDEAPRDRSSASGPGVLGYSQQARLVELLREHRGNVSAVAKALDAHRVQVYRWLKRAGLDAKDYRG